MLASGEKIEGCGQNVYFRKSDVVVAGDALVTTTFPRLDVQKGAGLAGAVQALNRILDLTIPKDK